MGRAKKDGVSGAKPSRKAKPPTEPAPAVATAELPMRLFAPGMTALHRAGLGGLACTLRAMERAYAAGVLEDDQLPGPFVDGHGPWDITDREVVLRFGTPEAAGEYLKRLFAFAFQIRDGVIYLPGQYPDPPPSLAVRADIQNAITRTFLQGAKKNIALEKTSTSYSVDPDGNGIGNIVVEYKRCLSYLHQKVWKSLINPATGALLPAPAKADGKDVNFGSLFAGAIKRHDALNESDITVTTGEMLCSVFFLVGCAASLLSSSGDGVLLTPEVHKVDEFVLDRPFMTPRSTSEVRVGGSADAAYQLEVRLLSRGMAYSSSVPGCAAQRFSLRTWTKPQKSRIDATSLDTDSLSRLEPEEMNVEELALDRFERALALLPRGVRCRSDGSTYWQDSIIRPMIADNLANDKSWYFGFHAIASTRKARGSLYRESRGLNAMIRDKVMWDDEREHVVVRAVQTAMLSLGGRIKEIYGDRPNLLYKKYDAEREKWGRIFAGNMTADQFRKNLADMFRRAGSNKELQANWRLLLPMLRRDTWEHARDLALVGLCSYQPGEGINSAGDGQSAI